MSEDTAGQAEQPKAGEPAPEQEQPTLPPLPTFGGESKPSRKARTTADEPDPEVQSVLGLGGEPIEVPTGVWFAETDGNGGLARDADGNVIRTRNPHTPPRRPLGPPVG